MLRKVLAVIIGLIIAILIFTLFEWIDGKIYPLPSGMDPADHYAMEAFAQTLPATALLIVLAGWAVGSVFCGLVVRLVARSPDRTPAYLAGLVLMTSGIVNVTMIHHPLWFIIIGIVLFIPLTLLGHGLYRRFDLK